MAKPRILETQVTPPPPGCKIQVDPRQIKLFKKASKFDYKTYLEHSFSALDTMIKKAKIKKRIVSRNKLILDLLQRLEAVLKFLDSCCFKPLAI